VIAGSRPRASGWFPLVLALGTAAAILGGCMSSPSTPQRVVWTDRVPTPPPEAVQAQPVVTRSQGMVTLLPISPTGAAIGVPYSYDMPHCGIGSAIDVDGSFWDPLDPPADITGFDGVPGSFELSSNERATFTTLTGAMLQLARHTGAKEFRTCL
jgi:hypothetical protein